MIAVGGLLLLFWCYLQWGTGIAEHEAQARLARQLGDRRLQRSVRPRARPDATTPYRWPTVPDGGPLARLVIPSIGLDQVVVQGTDTADLREGPGHYPSTPYPGQPGNVAIAGHRTTYAHPFYDLNELVPGDTIELSVPGGLWRYRVVGSLVVSPDDVAVAGPLGEPGSWLTLTTCNPRYSASTRLVVRAQLVDTTGPSNGPAKRARNARGRPVPPDSSSTLLAAGTTPGSAWPIVTWTILLGVVLIVGVLVFRHCRVRSLRAGLVLACGLAVSVVLFELFGVVAAHLPSGY